MSNIEEQLSTLFYFLTFLVLYTLLVSNAIPRLYDAILKHRLRRVIAKNITRTKGKLTAILMMIFTHTQYGADTRRVYVNESSAFLHECERDDSTSLSATSQLRASGPQTLFDVDNTDL